MRRLLALLVAFAALACSGQASAAWRHDPDVAHRTSEDQRKLDAHRAHVEPGN